MKSWATASLWDLPPSTSFVSAAKPAAMTALQAKMGNAQFCELPHARNSKRLPQKGKGAVRLRSSTFVSTGAADAQPGAASFFSAL